MRIRYYGHMGQRTGFAVAAEHYVAALRRAGATVETVSLNGGPIDTVGSPMEIHADEIDAVIVHTLPMDCDKVTDELAFMDTSSVRRPPCIAVTTWEALTIDHDLSRTLQNSFDEVWVPSQASAFPLVDQHEPGDEPNVFVVPYCMPEADFLVENHPKRNPEGRFRFYWSGAWTARKNPGGLIRAFTHAFRPGFPGYEGDVELYLHSHGTPLEALAAELAACGIDRADLPRIVLNNDYLSDDDMKILHARGDCFVSAARGEAWNLPCFEALVQRKHIVTTDGLGSDEFLRGTSAYRVGARPTPAWNTFRQAFRRYGVTGQEQIGVELVGAQGLTSRDLWLDPDLVQFAGSMRWVYMQWLHERREILIHYDMAERYGYAAVAKTILTRLENLIR